MQIEKDINKLADLFESNLLTNHIGKIIQKYLTATHPKK